MHLSIFRSIIRCIQPRDLVVLLLLEVIMFALLSLQEAFTPYTLSILPGFLLMQSVAPGFLLLSPFVPLDRLPLPLPVVVIGALVVIVVCALVHWAVAIYLVRRSIRDRSALAFIALILELGATTFGGLFIAAT
jgi:hypothetical protein